MLAALAAAPAAAMAAAGLLHPHHLTTATADMWLWLHVAGLLVFPLVGAGLVVPLAGRGDPVAWLVRVAAYVYATAYTALDVVSGIGAGWVTSRLPDGATRPQEVSWLFRIGTPIGEVGSSALIVATVVLVLDALRRRGAAATPLVLLPAGAWAVHSDHIFAPVGALGMAMIAVGTLLAVLGEGPRHDARFAVKATFSG